jgi:hypothetical protein
MFETWTTNAKKGARLLTKSSSGGFGESGKDSGQGEMFPDSKSLWEKISLSMVDHDSNRWFEDLGVRPASEVFAKQVELNGETLKGITSFLEGDEFGIVAKMQPQADEFDNKIAIDKSRLGSRVMEYLDANGVSYNFENSWAISYFDPIEVGTKERLEGQWSTELGKPFVQNLEVYKDSSGKETAYWFVQLLATPLALSSHNTLGVRDDDQTGRKLKYIEFSQDCVEKGGLTLGDISTKIHLPIFLKNLAYMCEAPYPDIRMLSICRDVAFLNIPLEARPIPTYVIERNSFAKGHSTDLSESEGGNRYNGLIFPEVVTFGWRFGEESLEYLEELMPTIIQGCVYAVSTAEDGFRNFSREDFSADWDTTVLSPCLFNPFYERGKSRLAWPQWIPVSEIGDIVATSHSLLGQAEAAADSDEGLKILGALFRDGVGGFMASAGNSLLYSFLIPELQDNPDTIGNIEWIANRVIEMNVLGESNNARCNLGLSYAILGLKEEAHAILEPVINGNLTDSVAEAYYYLGLLHSKLGDTHQADKYWQLGKTAGEFEAPDWLQLAESPPANDGSATFNSKAAFCAHCGSKFDNDAQKFCANCGAARS